MHPLENVLNSFRNWAGTNDEIVSSYFANHEDACHRFARNVVADWMVVDRDLLQELIFNPGGGVAALGMALAVMHGLCLYEDRWHNEADYRAICAAINGTPIADFNAFRAIAPNLWERFSAAIGYDAHVVFNRVIASLRVDLTVPVINTNTANALYDWLQNRGLLVNVNVQDNGYAWLDTSYNIRNSLYQHMPDTGTYDRRVFAWFLAEMAAGGEFPRCDQLCHLLQQNGL